MHAGCTWPAGAADGLLLQMSKTELNTQENDAVPVVILYTKQLTLKVSPVSNHHANVVVSGVAPFRKPEISCHNTNKELLELLVLEIEQ